MKNTKRNGLNMEQLDTVSGGNLGMTASDSKFFQDIGIMSESYSASGLMFSWESGSAKVDEAWAQFGITCVSAPILNNTYYYRGRKISRYDALMLVMKKTGNNLDINKYWSDPND
ncbi:hypothetical protein [Butyrivibrio sp. AE2032]|uniref:hypothetical protein n=1 Tax=Butyrivibrio sp. AE2032 TaxID=1458463 RepID=UPI000556184E|nr:hypothetical protein [Butyrivibrio sp. AE2032]